MRKDNTQLKGYNNQIEGKLLTKDAKVVGNTKNSYRNAFKENFRSENIVIRENQRDSSLERKVIELEQLNDNYAQEIKILTKALVV